MIIAAWTPDDNPLLHRRMGKLLEELGELVAVAARIQIQGLDAVDPSSQKTNRERLTIELGDVQAQIYLCQMDGFSDWGRVCIQASDKLRQMQEWENLLREQDTTYFCSRCRLGSWEPDGFSGSRCNTCGDQGTPVVCQYTAQPCRNAAACMMADRCVKFSHAKNGPEGD